MRGVNPDSLSPIAKLVELLFHLDLQMWPSSFNFRAIGWLDNSEGIPKPLKSIQLRDLCSKF